MIANATELDVAIRNLSIMTNALEALRQDMKERDPALFPIVSQTYLRRIKDLQDDIFAYLRQHDAQYVQPTGGKASAVREEGEPYLPSSSADDLPITSFGPGIDAGINLGLQAGKQGMLVRLVTKRFGSVPSEVLEHLQRATAAQLDSHAEELLDFSSIDELDAWVTASPR